MAQSLVQTAAQSHPTRSKRGFLERLFVAGFKRLVYAQIWEDPIVDLEALQLDPQSRLIAISSGGCNIMSYLTAAPKEIIAVDLNEAHISLLKLKLAAARRLSDPRQFQKLFTAAGRNEAGAIFDAVLAPVLDEHAAGYWQDRDWRGRRRISWLEDGFYRYGLLGRHIGTAHLIMRLHGLSPKPLLQARSMAHQRELYETHVAPVFKSRLARYLTKLPVAYFGLGIPPNQYEAMVRDSGGNMLRLCEARVRRLFCDFPIQDNYFAQQAATRRYDGALSSLPPYLAIDNFETIKAHAHRVEPNLISFTERLCSEQSCSLDGYSLLDAQDWMTVDQINALWHQINRTAKPSARVIFRTAGRETILSDMLKPEQLEQWSYLDQESARLTAADRSAIYGGFHIYERYDR